MLSIAPTSRPVLRTRAERRQHFFTPSAEKELDPLVWGYTKIMRKKRTIKKTFTSALRELNALDRAAGRGMSWKERRDRKKAYELGTLERPALKERVKNVSDIRAGSTNGRYMASNRERAMRGKSFRQRG